VSRLRQFPEHRFIGTRDDMVVYDCDAERDFARLSARIEEGRLLERKLLSSFAPDTAAEARNRGFTATR